VFYPSSRRKDFKRLLAFHPAVALIQDEAWQGGMIDKTWLDEAACQAPWHDCSIWVL